MVKRLIQVVVLAALMVGLVVGPRATNRNGLSAEYAGRMAPCALDGGGSTA